MVNLDGSGSSAGGAWRHNPGLTKTNGFGASRSSGSHDGVDFSGPLGSAIRAVHGGTVTRTGKPVWDYAALGDVITVKSDDGWQEIYQEFGGMNNIKVHTGQTIKPGQKIATLGPLNGAGNGPHVHIGVSHGSLWNHGRQYTWLVRCHEDAREILVTRSQKTRKLKLTVPSPSLLQEVGVAFKFMVS